MSTEQLLARLEENGGELRRLHRTPLAPRRYTHVAQRGAFRCFAPGLCVPLMRALSVLVCLPADSR